MRRSLGPGEFAGIVVHSVERPELCTRRSCTPHSKAFGKFRFLNDPARNRHELAFKDPRINRLQDTSTRYQQPR